MTRRPSLLLPGILFYLDDVDFSARELNLAVADCEKGEIPAHLDVLAGEKFGSALPNDDTACLGDFTGIQLNASVFRIAVSAVSC
jgi:hypothetical protein